MTAGSDRENGPRTVVATRIQGDEPVRGRRGRPMLVRPPEPPAGLFSQGHPIVFHFFASAPWRDSACLPVVFF